MALHASPRHLQWHSDNSYMEAPSKMSVLVGVELPEYGNDTMFACTHAAYNGLSAGLKHTLCKLNAIHGAGRAFSTDDKGRQVLPCWGIKEC